MAGEPEALYLVSYPVDGATIARAWISGGGPQKFLLNDGMNSTDFIAAVGAQYLGDAFGTSSGTTTTASTEYFNGAYEAFSGGIKAREERETEVIGRIVDECPHRGKPQQTDTAQIHDIQILRERFFVRLIAEDTKPIDRAIPELPPAQPENSGNITHEFEPLSGHGWPNEARHPATSNLRFSRSPAVNRACLRRSLHPAP